jgi:SAM-dependent methyltransferase
MQSTTLDAALDENMHKLSMWGYLDANGFKDLSRASWAHFDPPVPHDQPVKFLEVASGVGAHARRFMLDFPLSTGIGIDVEESAIKVANKLYAKSQLLSKLKGRHESRIGDMLKLKELAKDGPFDFVLFFPYVLNYVRSLSALDNVFSAVSKLLKPGGQVSFTSVVANDMALGLYRKEGGMAMSRESIKAHLGRPSKTAKAHRLGRPTDQSAHHAAGLLVLGTMGSMMDVIQPPSTADPRWKNRFWFTAFKPVPTSQH